MAIITTGNIISALRPGVNKHFGLEYKAHPAMFSRLFDIFKSQMNWEVDVNVNGFELASVKQETGSVRYVSQSEAFRQFYRHVTYAIGYIVSREEMDDNLYPNLIKSRSRELARSMMETKERIAANIINRAIDPTALWADGQPLLSTGHLLSKGGTYSNKLAVPMDLSEEALEQACQMLWRWTDDAGKLIKLSAVELFIPPELEFIAERILKSAQQGDTALNNINALKSLGRIRNGYSVNPYFTDADQWIIKTDEVDGFKHFVRDAVELSVDVAEFNTENVRAKARERYSFGVTNPRCCIGSEGAV